MISSGAAPPALRPSGKDTLRMWFNGGALCRLGARARGTSASEDCCLDTPMSARVDAVASCDRVVAFGASVGVSEVTGSTYILRCLGRGQRGFEPVSRLGT